MAKVIVRGYEIEVQAKSGSQLAFIKRQLEQRSDEWLKKHGTKVRDNA